MELPPEYWRERADRVRRTADFVDEKARETLLRIAGDYDSLAQRAQRQGRMSSAK